MIWLNYLSGSIPPDGTAFEFETDRLMIKVENIKEHRVEAAVVTKKIQ